MKWTSANIVSAFKRRAVIPDSQNYVEDSEILLYMNDALRMKMCPLIMRTKSEYFVKYEEVTTDSDGFGTIPSRAIGERVRKIEWVSNGQAVVLDQLNVGSMTQYSYFANGQPAGYIFQDNQIQLLPKAVFDVNVYFFRRPNGLTQDKAIISNIASLVLTVDDVPTDWAVGMTLDAALPYAQKSKVEDITITAISGSDITVSSATGLAIGDYLTESGFSYFPEIPKDLVEIWIQHGIVLFAESSGYLDMAAMAKSELGELTTNMFQMISDRDDASPKKAISRRNIWNFRRGRW
jgi:hypothetical protein